MSGGAEKPVRVLYFAWLRERVGMAEETVSLPEGVADVGGLVAWLRGRSPGHAAAFEHASLIRCAINQDMADAKSALSSGDEVAFFPPVTGG